MSFNPTLVRLAPFSRATCARACGGFNPTLVRLALDGHRIPLHIALGFNPTLVRLAPVKRGSGEWINLRFQSHPGSISTGKPLDLTLHVGGFQSHPGSISTMWS